MAKTRAEVEMLVSQQSAIQAFQQFTSQFKKMMDTMDSRSRGSEEQAKKTSSAFGEWTRQLAKAMAAGAGFGGILQTIRTVSGLIRQEFEAILNLQRSSADQQIEFEKGLERVEKLLPSDTDITVPQIRQMVLSRQRTGDISGIVRAIEQSLSAGLDLPPSRRVELVLRAHELAPEQTAEALGALAEAAQASQTQFGGTEEQQLAAMIQALPLSRVTELEKFAKNIAPGVALFGATTNATQREAFAMLAAIGKRAEDESGRITRNASLVFGEQLRETTAPIIGPQATFDQMRQFIRSGDPRAKMIRSRLLGSFDLEAAQLREQARTSVDDEARSELLGRARVQVALRELIQAEDIPTKTKDLYDIAYRQFTGAADETVKFVEEKVRQRLQDPGAAALQVQRALESSDVRLKNITPEAVEGLVADYLRQLDVKAGGSDLAGRIRSLKFRFQFANQSDSTAALGELIEQARQVEGSIGQPPTGGPYLWDFDKTNRLKVIQDDALRRSLLTPEDKTRSDALLELIKRLEVLVEQLRTSDVTMAQLKDALGDSTQAARDQKRGASRDQPQQVELVAPPPVEAWPSGASLLGERPRPALE